LGFTIVFTAFDEKKNNLKACLASL
jgi:hypothetical protein